MIAKIIALLKKLELIASLTKACTLIKEDENIRYLELSPEQRRRSSKANYFKTSTSYFKQAQKTCLYTLKRFKNFKGRGIVYYILAFNAKEFRQIDNAKKYFDFIKTLNIHQYKSFISFNRNL